MTNDNTTPQGLQKQIDGLRAEFSELSVGSMDEAHKIALGHAWDHFSYHANQRLVTFRFYLIIAAILVGAYLKLMSDHAIVVASIIASVGVVFSYVFLRLDFRNKDLIKLSEDVLIIEEEKLESKVGYEEIKIIARSNSSESQRTARPRSFGQALKFLFNAMIVLFLLGALVPYTPLVSLFPADVQ